MGRALWIAGLLSAAVAIAGPARVAALTISQKCEVKAVSALRKCLKTVRKETGKCYAASGAACPASHSKIVAALAKMDEKVQQKCAGVTTVQAAGYGALMSAATLGARLRETCLGEPAALAARSFGGPHAAGLVGADAAGKACLLDAFDAAGGQIDKDLRTLSGCFLRAHKGSTCDVPGTLAKLAAERAKALQKIQNACAGTLASLVAVDESRFVDRAAAQAECLTAAAVGNSGGGPLALACGPRAAAPVPARGVVTQVILPEAVWGSRCGNGSPYAFRLRLPPVGQPVEKVVVHMQGGGACFNGTSCANQAAGLFSATEDGMPSGGIMSNNAANNPVFANWTKVFLPYCTQDLHIGGGVTNVFPEITVHRYGGLNVRAALRYVRDVLWAEMNATQTDGYRPDRLQVMFAGTSAGGFGVNYNYHYVLDDLRWIHASAVPDAGLGLGGAVLALGAIMTSTVQPGGWDATSFLAPYCFAGQCAQGPVIKAAHAARLLAVPEQQILEVSNQVDNVQVATTVFPNLVSWINALRDAYCDNQGVPGLHSFLSAETGSIHGTLLNANFTTLTSAGVILGDWLANAATAPATVTDAVSEGTLVATYGADPFACPVSP